MSVHEDLEAWVSAEIHGFILASIPSAEWPARVERLLTDASHLVSSLDDLTERRIKLHSMVSFSLIPLHPQRKFLTMSSSKNNSI